MIYIVAVWDADSVCPGGGCKTAQCRQDAKGRIFCAKPLKKCSKDKCEAGKECFRKSDGKVMTPETSTAAIVEKEGKKTWAVKEVKPCPAHGDQAKCKVGEHVKLKDGKAACTPADVKHAEDAKAGIPAPLQDNNIVEEDCFSAFAD